MCGGTNVLVARSQDESHRWNDKSSKRQVRERKGRNVVWPVADAQKQYWTQDRFLVCSEHSPYVMTCSICHKGQASSETILPCLPCKRTSVLLASSIVALCRTWMIQELTKDNRCDQQAGTQRNSQYSCIQGRQYYKKNTLRKVSQEKPTVHTSNDYVLV